jgi:thiamine kinase-like enzyme
MIRNQYVDFESYRIKSQISNKQCLKLFLRELYHDLVDKEQIGLSKNSFLIFMNLPLIISERLFEVLKTSRTGDSLTERDFVNGLYCLYAGNLEETQALIFDYLDTRKEGKINRDYVGLLLKFIVGVSNKEIDRLIQGFFGDRYHMDYRKFCNTVEKSNSDIYFYILYYFNMIRPFCDRTLNVYLYDRSKYNSDTPQCKRKLSKSVFASPTTKLLNKCGLDVDLKLFKLEEEDDDPELAELATDDLTDDLFLPKFDIKSMSYLDIKYPGSMKLVTRIDPYWEVEKISLKHESICFVRKKESNMLDSDVMSEGSEDIDYEGYIYRLTEKGKKKFWLVLCNQTIFYFDSREKMRVRGFHTLMGCFVNTGVSEEYIEGKRYFCFTIYYNKTSRVYYCKSKSLANNWIRHIQINTRFRNFDNDYTIIAQIGEGNFGKVYLGQHNITEQRVAIKVLDKLETSEKEIADQEVIRTEIEILKFCSHRNILKYIDHYEDYKNIYLIEEYLHKGSLETYLSKGAIHENKCRDIMKQIGEGLKYLHEHGVVHCDLKPQNILLTDDNGSVCYKIIDFGLSKILGKGEKYYKVLGTVYFIAPEVYMKCGFTHKADIWSLGVILHHLLFGNLPFEGKDEDEVANFIVNRDYKVPSFEYVSKMAKDLVSNCLVRNFELRYGIDEFLKHDWFKY